MTHPLLNMVEARLRHGHFAAPSGTLLLTEDVTADILQWLHMLLKWLMTQNYTAKATKEFRKAKKLDIFQCLSVI